HEHYVGDDAILAGRKAELAIGEPHLADDLGRGQVAIEALLAGGAEAAVHGAAHLTRNTQRAAPRLGNEHHFHGLSDSLRARALRPGHCEQPLAHAVCGDLRSREERKSTRLNSSHVKISYAVFRLKKKKRLR